MHGHSAVTTPEPQLRARMRAPRKGYYVPTLATFLLCKGQCPQVGNKKTNDQKKTTKKNKQKRTNKKERIKRTNKKERIKRTNKKNE
jgi:hypothetical protein